MTIEAATTTRASTAWAIRQSLADQGGDRLLNDVETATVLGIGVSSVWRHVRKTPGFPHPIRFGRTTRWRRSDLNRFIAFRSDEVLAAGICRATPNEAM
jgi:predicted DNA-binding transcriptional regulator AlpA